MKGLIRTPAYDYLVLQASICVIEPFPVIPPVIAPCNQVAQLIGKPMDILSRESHLHSG